jgi:hypothetical protein
MATVSTSSRKKAPTVTFLRAYKFGDNQKDPIIDRVRTVLDDEGCSIYDCHKQGGPSPSTLHNWFEGATRRPQYATICAALRSVGYDFVLQKVQKHVNGKPWEAEAPKIARTVQFVRPR